MTHHNNKPSNFEPKPDAKASLRLVAGHLQELHGLVRELDQSDWKTTQTSRRWNRFLVLVQEISTIAEGLQDKLSDAAKKDLTSLSADFADYSADGEFRRNSFGEDFDKRKAAVDKTLLHLIEELKAA